MVSFPREASLQDYLREAFNLVAGFVLVLAVIYGFVPSLFEALAEDHLSTQKEEL